MRSADVRRIYAEGRTLHGGSVVLFLAPGTGRLAVVAARRVGGAVERNRARRILKEAWRQVATQEETDAVLVAKVAIRGSKTQELVAEMTELLRVGGANR